MKYFALAICLFAFITIPGCTPDVPPVPQCVTQSCDNDLAGRYHLRGRTTKFFGKVAGRYHLRGRTTKFFGRVV